MPEQSTLRKGQNAPPFHTLKRGAVGLISGNMQRAPRHRMAKTRCRCMAPRPVRRQSAGKATAVAGPAVQSTRPCTFWQNRSIPAVIEENGARFASVVSLGAAGASVPVGLVRCARVLYGWRLRGIFLKQVRTQNQAVHAGFHEAAIGVRRRPDDRLAAHVERSV